MSKQDKYGYVISKGEGYIIREKIIEGKSLFITIHPLDKDGKELQQLSYVLGHNSLLYQIY